MNRGLLSTLLLSKIIITGFLLIFISLQTFSQDYGKSYVNITKGTTGSTIEPGDTLEIRATFVVRSGTYTQCSFSDVVPANTTYVPGTLRVLTNEGKVFRQWTDAAGDDAGTLSGSNITINLGTGATSAAGGSIKNTDKPSFYHGSCIMVASYRVVVNAVAYGTKIGIGTGNLTYKSGSVVNITFPQDTIVVYQNYGICSNTVGTNAIITEFGGTFGTGNIKDRGASSSVPSNYTYAAFSSAGNMPNDYYYGVTNNTSGGTTAATGYSTVDTWAFPDNSQAPSHRIFSVWDIIGDHTGASNPLLGNQPTDDNAGSSGGYMLAINASYRTDTAFLDTVTNLCPNTYYQYVAWFRNICSKCGCDSNGTGATSASGYIPTAVGDSSGVHPNLTFNVNGYDYYTTGDILHTGQWIQKGFIYKTGMTETSMIISVRNNAPGGGGNDWVIDDINVASCTPNIVMTPANPQTLCQGADDTVGFKVTSYFSNYTEWAIQQSFDNGVTWSSPGNDTTGQLPTGSATPVFNTLTGQYEYSVTRYYQLDYIHTLVKYRVIIASTSANLSNPNCSFSAGAPNIVNAVNCLTILPANFIYVNGQLKDGLANLKWLTVNESGNIQYVVERSSDQVTFEIAGTVSAHIAQESEMPYNFIDTKPVSDAAYYRIRMVSGNNQKISQVILLSTSEINFDVRSLINPFSNQLSFQMAVPNNDIASLTLVDIYGRIIRQQKQDVTQGLNNIIMYDLGNLPVAAYTLKIQYADKMVIKLVIKKN
jgi:hypothetical protein